MQPLEYEVSVEETPLAAPARVSSAAKDSATLYAGKALVLTTNIAGLPHYSPFRYPGGKTWFTPIIRAWLKTQPSKVLYEPFAGGATASLIAVMEGHVERAVLTDRDPQVAAVWRTIFSKDVEHLVERILKFKLTTKSVLTVLGTRPRSRVSLAFQTILKNRCRRGGILAHGAGLLVKGERGKGLASRWYPETLARRILKISDFRSHFCFRDIDGMQMLTTTNRIPSPIKVFVDPPYPKLMRPGVRPLYDHRSIDHPRLFEILAEGTSDFLFTYEDSPHTRQLVVKKGFAYRTIEVPNSNSDRKREIVVTRCESLT